MNRTVILIAALLTSAFAQAQTIRLNAFSGYTFQDRFPLYGSYSGYAFQEGRVAASAHYGGGLEFELRPRTALELFYQAQPTEGYVRTSFQEYGPTEVTVSYVMLGGLQYMPFSELVHGYCGLNIGAAFSNAGSDTKFAWGAKLGLRIDASPTVGLKLGAQLLSPVDQVGGGLYFGTGGASAGVSTYSTVYQFGLTGGLVFTLK